MAVEDILCPLQRWTRTVDHSELRRRNAMFLVELDPFGKLVDGNELRCGQRNAEAITEAPQSRALRSTGSWASAEAAAVTERRRPRFDPRAAIAAILFIAIIGLAIWYLVRPEPLLVQGEAESTRIDIAARVTGRLAKIEVHRGQDVAAGATLLVIENPELVAQLHEDEAESRGRCRIAAHKGWDAC